ncbi:hypothetical protein J6590_059905 [Homalodisca vitripennis]|nr:hypothetical protein J6590_059905 [Homalodisca vitripennis]
MERCYRRRPASRYLDERKPPEKLLGYSWDNLFSKQLNIDEAAAPPRVRENDVGYNGEDRSKQTRNTDGPSDLEPPPHPSPPISPHHPFPAATPDGEISHWVSPTF